MNILYINSHDSGRYVQPYHEGVPTPTIRRVAEEGVTFRRAFSASPTCSPSRAALLTGQYPSQCGMFGLAHSGWQLNDYSRHLAPVLSRAGYTSAIAGFQHVAHPTTTPLADVGYDRLLNHDARGEYHEPNITNAAVDFINEQHDKPFYLEVGYFETHRDNQNNPGHFTKRQHDDADPRYVHPPERLPDWPESRQEWANYRVGAKILDDNIGRLLDALDANGLRQNTLVIITTDHGLPMPRMKATLSDGGLEVMLIVRGPTGSTFSGGKVVEALASHVDLYPTILKLAGADVPEGHEGVDLASVVEGGDGREHVYGQMHWHGGTVAPQRSVRGERYKYVKWFPSENAPLDDWPWQSGNGVTVKRLEEAGMPDRMRDESLIEQLYDLYVDPLEMDNLAGDPAFKDHLQELRSVMTRWMERTDDPLLRGEVPQQRPKAAS